MTDRITVCLNPLHCGAVVASLNNQIEALARNRVSIPFIAGQWSLHTASERDLVNALSLNPLHCGAVVASFCRPYVLLFRKRRSQSPSLRGSGRF